MCMRLFASIFNHPEREVLRLPRVGAGEKASG